LDSPPVHHHPRSIFRSRLFWLALPGLIFLLWGWFNDPEYYNGTYLCAGDHSLVIADNGRQVYLDARTASSPGRVIAPYCGYFRERRANVDVPRDPQTLFSDAIVCGIEREPEVSKAWANLAYWLLILLYLAALFAIRLWWQRRKSRLIAAALPQRSASHS
jgi:hypothetical protein